MTAQNLRSQTRLQFHSDALARKTERLNKLVPGTPAYIRCINSMEKDRQVLAQVSSKLTMRQEAGKGNGPAYTPAKRRGPRKGQTFEIVLGDEPEAGVMMPFSVRDENGHFVKQA